MPEKSEGLVVDHDSRTVSGFSPGAQVNLVRRWPFAHGSQALDMLTDISSGLEQTYLHTYLLIRSKDQRSAAGSKHIMES